MTPQLESATLAVLFTQPVQMLQTLKMVSSIIHVHLLQYVYSISRMVLSRTLKIQTCMSPNVHITLYGAQHCPIHIQCA